MLKQLNLFTVGALVVAVLMSGCKRNPEATIVQMGVSIAYSTETTGFMHSTSTLGVVRLPVNNARFSGLRGCPPYFTAGLNDPYIVMCRAHGDFGSGPDLVLANVVDGTWFSLKYGFNDIGCTGDIQLSRTDLGFLQILKKGQDAHITLIVDTKERREVSYQYVKMRATPDSASVLEDAGARVDPAVRPGAR